MTKEQEEAIEKLEYYLKNSAYKRENSDFFKNGGWEIVDLEIPKAIETTLNLVKDLQRKNFELNQKNEYYAWLNKDLKDEIKRLKKELNNE